MILKRKCTKSAGWSSQTNPSSFETMQWSCSCLGPNLCVQIPMWRNPPQICWPWKDAHAAHAYRLLHPATMLLCATAPLRSRSEMLSNALLHNLIQWVSSSLLWSRIQEWCTWAGPWKGSFHLRHERVTCVTGKGKKVTKTFVRSPSYTNVASLSFPSLSVKLSTSSASTVGSANKAAKKNRASVCTTDAFIDSQWFTGEKRSCTVDSTILKVPGLLTILTSIDSGEWTGSLCPKSYAQPFLRLIDFWHTAGSSPSHMSVTRHVDI